jgi:putative nucleotidyltransferase with HDIG domain
LISGFLPLLESTFSTTTDISWLELGDLNHPLLKRLQLNAPGTFHHSLVMASLAEAAAESIGANAAMCRACAYFHDVGKLSKPDYFIENQADDSTNPHNALTPNMSALVIIAHVKDGVDLALKYKLNHRIIDAIREHHGDTLVFYFYRKAQEQLLAEQEKVDKGLGNSEDLPYVDEKNFRYPGPRPRSKETGILSLADAVESASRSIKKPTPVKIRALVDDIVKSRWADGQLDDCPLTMRDLTKIRESFAHTLRSMLHTRISYKTEDGSDRKTRGGQATERDMIAIGDSTKEKPKEP